MRDPTYFRLNCKAARGAQDKSQQRDVVFIDLRNLWAIFKVSLHS